MSYGLSVENRPLLHHRLGPTSSPVSLLVFGAIHGDEPDSARLCDLYLDRLRTQPPAHPVIIIPVANPDGLARRTKNNARDVDLNRNWLAANFTTAHAPNYDPGPAPLSEPETAHLHALLEATQPRIIIAVHQPLACVNWDGPAASLAHTLSRVARLPPQPSIGYPTPGSFGSFWGLDHNRPVITLELSRTPDAAELARAADALDCARLHAACP